MRGLFATVGALIGAAAGTVLLGLWWIVQLVVALPELTILRGCVLVGAVALAGMIYEIAHYDRRWNFEATWPDL